MKSADPNTLAAVLDRVQREAVAVPPEAIPERLAATKKRFKEIERTRENLLGMERVAQSILDSKLVQLEREHVRLQGLANGEISHPMVSTEPLRWRNAQGLPQFALFNIDNPNFEIVGYSNRSPDMVPGLPIALRECYGDVEKRLTRKAKLRPLIRAAWIAGLIAIGALITALAVGNTNVFYYGNIGAIAMFVVAAVVCSEEYQWSSFIKVTYRGLIPESVRKEIRKAKDCFGQIYVLTEVPKWRIRHAVEPNKDPLVLGWKNGNLWLITSFDTTPIEEYIKQEFAG